MKKAKQVIRALVGREATEADYRGLLALILTIGFLAAIFLEREGAVTALGPLAGTAIGWYFGGK